MLVLLNLVQSYLKKQEENCFHCQNENEEKFDSLELQLLAIFYALERFRLYLKGITIKIATDCNILQMPLKKKNIFKNFEMP